MNITALVENNSSSKKYVSKHGLSLYIEMDDKKILFDVGPDKTFIENANKLDIDIKDVDILIISHGHKDHGGGLEEFIKVNKKAKIYINRYAFDPHYTLILGVGKYYVGLNEKLKHNNRIVFVDGTYKIDERLYLFNNKVENNEVSVCNKSLLMRENNKYIQDDFRHEQNLIVINNKNKTLICGCAHSGIVNIIDRANNILNGEVDTVIGGFHLFNPALRKSEDKGYIYELAKKLSNNNTMYYTGHCTGVKAYNILKKTLKNKIEYISTGDKIKI